MSNEILTHAMQMYQGREEPERFYAIAGKYWRIMLSIEICICIAAVAGGAYFLVMTLFDSNTGKAQDAPAQAINRAQLTKTIQGLRARQALYEEIKAGAGHASDPSR